MAREGYGFREGCNAPSLFFVSSGVLLESLLECPGLLIVRSLQA